MRVYKMTTFTPLYVKHDELNVVDGFEIKVLMSDREIFPNESGEYIVEPNEHLKIVITQNVRDAMELYTFINDHRNYSKISIPTTVFDEITNDYGRTGPPIRFTFEPYRKGTTKKRHQWTHMHDRTLDQAIFLEGEKMHVRMCVLIDLKPRCIFDSFFVTHTPIPETDVPYRMFHDLRY